MRGAPQVGFSTTILKISSRISFESLFLPTECCAREMSLQYKRKPAWCQPTTVSGVTTISEVPPIAPDPPGGHPEHFVEDADPRTWMPTLEHHKLLSQGEILKHQRTAGTEQAENRRETEPNDGKYSSDIPELDAMRSLRKSLILKPSSILARHSPCSSMTNSTLSMRPRTNSDAKSLAASPTERWITFFGVTRRYSISDRFPSGVRHEGPARADAHL